MDTYMEVIESGDDFPQDWFDLNYKLQSEAIDSNMVLHSLAWVNLYVVAKLSLIL